MDAVLPRAGVIRRSIADDDAVHAFHHAPALAFAPLHVLVELEAHHPSGAGVGGRGKRNPQVGRHEEHVHLEPADEVPDVLAEANVLVSYMKSVAHRIERDYLVSRYRVSEP